ncbi:MAG: hypothetical protein Q9172_000245 [Xanthocarpia lactea]
MDILSETNVASTDKTGLALDVNGGNLSSSMDVNLGNREREKQVRRMETKPAPSVINPPFREEHQLDDELDHILQCNVPQVFPSNPRLSLNSAALQDFLMEDVCPSKLNRLAPHLWMCSAPSHKNVPPLHNHAVHNRNIVLTEDPGLHLVWETGRIFIKPLPTYLLSHAFWVLYLLNGEMSSEQKLVKQAALGLLRSYHHCIRYESDLRIAQQAHLNLIPPGVTWKQWCDFSSSFDGILDSHVAPRYHYGKLQLSRLHWLVRIHLRELNYYYIDGGYGDSFARYYGPLLFVFDEHRGAPNATLILRTGQVSLSIFDDL